MCLLRCGQWLTVKCAHMVKGIHHDQASWMCSSSIAQFGHMVKDIQHDQGSLMCDIAWSAVNSPIWSYGQGYSSWPGQLTLQFGQWFMVQCDQGNLWPGQSNVIAWSAVNNPFWSYGQLYSFWPGQLDASINIIDQCDHNNIMVIGITKPVECSHLIVWLVVSSGIWSGY